MTDKRKVEVFTAGCVLCDETVALVAWIANSSYDDVKIHDMRQPAVERKAKQYGCAACLP
jgi:glutaredoxin 3